MSRLRKGRRRYYDLFSHFYDGFIRLHARRDEDDTRRFLVDAAHRENKQTIRVLDICCGTGSVVFAFAERYHHALLVGYDFSHGMLGKARQKNVSTRALFVEGDAAELPFPNDSFDIVTCSHALYELKGPAREKALWEMKRVMHPEGLVLLMEHEVPGNPVLKLLFHFRLLSMGSDDAREFVEGGLDRLQNIFPRVVLRHSTSGKSRLMICQEQSTRKNH
jgi:ubiquinone/menaquinone biosynthesis C-methylase UbiE